MQLDIIQAEKKRDEGIKNAVTKADFDNKDWSVRCWELFLKWLGKKEPGFHFMIENFRDDVYKWGKLEKPNSDRAYGFLSRRAGSQKLIRSAGKAKTKSTSSHRANAEVWVKI